MCKKLIKINDIPSKLISGPLIQLKALSGMNPNWLFETGAAVTCISIDKFRQIAINSRQTKIHSFSKKASRSNGGSLIRRGSYMIPIEYKGRKIIQKSASV